MRSPNPMLCPLLCPLSEPRPSMSSGATKLVRHRTGSPSPVSTQDGLLAPVTTVSNSTPFCATAVLCPGAPSCTLTLSRPPAPYSVLLCILGSPFLVRFYRCQSMPMMHPTFHRPNPSSPLFVIFGTADNGGGSTILCLKDASGTGGGVNQGGQDSNDFVVPMRREHANYNNRECLDASQSIPPQNPPKIGFIICGSAPAPRPYSHLLGGGVLGRGLGNVTFDYSTNLALFFGRVGISIVHFGQSYCAHEDHDLSVATLLLACILSSEALNRHGGALTC